MSRVIVFTRTKHGADKLQRDLEKSGITAAAIHGNKSQNQRERALAAFKSQRPPVLIATDIAARGIDVDGVSHVVNYELSHEPETYVHRIGRTGRAGMTGMAVSFCDHEERPRLKAIERLIRKAIPVRNDLPEFPTVDFGPEANSAGRGEGSMGGGRRGNSGRQGQGNRSRSGSRGTVIGGEGGGGSRGGDDRRGNSRSTIRHKHTRGGHTGGPQQGQRPSSGQDGNSSQPQGLQGGDSSQGGGTATSARPPKRKSHRRAL